MKNLALISRVRPPRRLEFGTGLTRETGPPLSPDDAATDPGLPGFCRFRGSEKRRRRSGLSFDPNKEAS
jgi:hypothetical protein